MSKRKMAQQDLTIESLPHTRKDLFFDTLKIRFKLIFALGVFLALSTLPMLVVFFLKDLSLQNLFKSFESAAITEEEYNLIYMQQNNFWNLLELPCFVILGVFLAGCMRVIRQLNYSVGIHLKDDFRIGIKQNSFQYIFMSVFAFIIFYLTSFVSNLDINNEFALYFPIGLSLIIFVPLFFVMACLIVTYSLKIKDLLKIGIALSIKNILWNAVFVVAFFAPILLFIIPYYFIIYSVFILFLIFYYPILLMALYFFNYSSFDEFINKEQYPDYYHKGLY